jgi:5-methylcytosine-specific restriction endonuclease McrBC regulatory subunit McrC
MDNDVIQISALDCLPFYHLEAKAGVLQSFIESQQLNICYLTKAKNIDEESKLAEYNYLDKKWYAGRFIGEAFFYHENQSYKITIKPRFGENVLLRMLEEIFNIRITKSASIQSNKDDWQHYIKRIISFIWIQKLANANLHGIPKVHISKEYKGQSIKGRISVRKTIKPYYTSGELISIYREKQIDDTIAQILLQAYQIIRSDFGLGKGINFPDAAQDAINQINAGFKYKKLITESDYKNIKYKEIYLSWKPIVDFSWDILKRKQLSLKQEKSKNGYGFFLDMAEIWEQYLRSLLKKNLQPLGWYLKNQNFVAYNGYFFKRNLIPDLIFEKENEVIILDAKYKRMTGDYRDVDRADFFQIHTYLLSQFDKKVKVGGLLYPITMNNGYSSNEFRSPYLLNPEGLKIKFAIEGIELQEGQEQESFQNRETEFVNRIKQDILQ